MLFAIHTQVHVHSLFCPVQILICTNIFSVVSRPLPFDESRGNQKSGNRTGQYCTGGYRDQHVELLFCIMCVVPVSGHVQHCWEYMDHSLCADGLQICGPSFCSIIIGVCPQQRRPTTKVVWHLLKWIYSFLIKVIFRIIDYEQLLPCIEASKHSHTRHNMLSGVCIGICCNLLCKFHICRVLNPRCSLAGIISPLKYEGSFCSELNKMVQQKYTHYALLHQDSQWFMNFPCPSLNPYCPRLHKHLYYPPTQFKLQS